MMKYIIIIALFLTQVDVFSQGSKGYILEMSDGTLRGVPNGSITNAMMNITPQATLVSGTNIKTVNGNNLLGSGDIAISGTAAWGSVTGTLSNQTDLNNALNLKAPLASPTFTGTVILPNATVTNAMLANPTTFINLASAFSSTSTTPAVVTGWSFAVTSGKTYRITVIADYQTAATTTGGQLGISLTASAVGTVRGYAMGTVANTAAASDLIIPIRATSGTGSILVTTAVTAASSPHYIGMDITFTCTTSGQFNVVWATEIAASASQLNANSSLIYQALN